MKKSLFILISLFCLKGFSQVSIELKNTVTSATISPNEIITTTTTPSTIEKITIDVKNTSGSTKTYNVKRYDMVVNPGALANFCFAGYCYGNDIIESPNSLTLNGNESASQSTVAFNMLDADLTETTTVGYSLVRYTVINVANSADSIQFSVKYNATLGVNENAVNTLSSFEVFPNPATDAAVLKVNAQKATTAKVVIYNALGAVVSERTVSMAEGKNKIDLNVESLGAGVYFAQIKTANNSVTKRLIVK